MMKAATRLPRKRLSSTEKHYMLMLLPVVILLIIFAYLPMGGVLIAFQKFNPAKNIWGSPFVGWDNFKYMFQIPNVGRVFLNTIIIACSKVVLNIIVPVFVALLLNEVRVKKYKRVVQTLIYLPYFLSWVILGTTIKQMFSLTGIVNQSLGALGAEPIMFLQSNSWFRTLIIGSDVWKNFGFGTIIYLAAIMNINPQLYEAAAIDGGGRLRRMWHITLPGIAPTIVLMSTLSLGNVLNAGMEQILTLYNPLVYESADIIDTFVYREGILGAQYGLSTAVGLFKSFISFGLIVISYKMAAKFASYRIF